MYDIHLLRKRVVCVMKGEWVESLIAYCMFIMRSFEDIKKGIPANRLILTESVKFVQVSSRALKIRAKI